MAEVSNMMVSSTGEPKDVSLRYQIEMDHKEFCKLQSMLILLYNIGKSNLRDDELVLIREWERRMLNHRGAIGT